MQSVKEQSKSPAFVLGAAVQPDDADARQLSCFNSILIVSKLGMIPLKKKVIVRGIPHSVPATEFQKLLTESGSLNFLTAGFGPDTYDYFDYLPGKSK